MTPRLALKALAGLVIGILFVTAGTKIGVAIASADPVGSAAVPAAPLPEPSIESAGLVVKLWKSGAVLPSIVVAAFLLLKLFGATHWVSQGKRAAYVAGAMAFLTAIVGTAAQGTTPTLPMLIAALGAAVALIVTPTKAQAPS